MTLLKPNRGILRRTVLASAPALLLPRGLLAGIARPGKSSYTGPLDIVPGAVVAYSQRAMSAALRGSALYTIREAAGDTTQSFNSDATTGEAPVSAINTFLNGADGFGFLWNNQGSASADADLSVGEQGKWDIIGASTKPSIGRVGAMSFQNTDPFAILSADQEFTIFSVVYVDASDSGNTQGFFRLYSSTTSAACQVYGGAGFFDVDGSDAIDNEFEYDADGSDFAGLKIFEVVCASGSLTMLINGVEQTYTPSGAVPLSEINGRVRLRLPSVDGDISSSAHYEHALWPAVIGAPNRLAIRQNIALYYGIVL